MTPNLRLFVALASAMAVASSTSAEQTLLTVDICNRIERSLSRSSKVYYPGSSEYTADIHHYLASSTEQAQCSVRPATAVDVGSVLRLVGSTRTPFAVKGGGHAWNKGFSSTTGVQISMSEFKEVQYEAEQETAEIGAGLRWSEVYAMLEPHGAAVAGGRAPDVGVAGLTLGGGYSWHTNQYGLTVDNVVAFELVLPNGSVQKITESSNKDLFFALRGGGNNFGIVTKFTLRTHKQGLVWGGPFSFWGPAVDQVASAVTKYVDEVEDPKSAITATYGYENGSKFVSVTLFYDGPSPPSGIFDNFLAIPATKLDIRTRSFTSFVNTVNPSSLSGKRGASNTIPHTKITEDLLETLMNETIYFGQSLAAQSLSHIAYSVEPFLRSAYFRAASPTAFPPDRSQIMFPLQATLVWEDAAEDERMQDALGATSRNAFDAALVEGDFLQSNGKYSNYAMGDTPVEEIYRGNTQRLREIRRKVDPQGVMKLTGGFKL